MLEAKMEGDCIARHRMKDDFLASRNESRNEPLRDNILFKMLESIDENDC